MSIFRIHSRDSTGHNNPEKSTPITTGTYKKKETYHEQAMEHENPAKQAQESTVRPKTVLNEGMTHKADSHAEEADGEHRSGSDSNAHKHRKDTDIHES